MIPRILDAWFGQGGRLPLRLGRRARRGILAGAVLLAAVILSLALLPSRKGGPPAGGPDGGAVPRVTKGRFRSTIVLTGKITAVRSEEFKVPITENYRVQIKWMVKEGDPVKPGDPVVRFDTASLASSIETAQDSLKAKREEKAQKEADYENQKYELDVEVKKAENDNRQKSLDASIPPGLEARYEYDRKQLEKKISDNSLEVAQRNRSVKRAELESQIQTLTIEARELQAKLEKQKMSLSELTLVARTEGAVIYAVDDWNGRKVQVGDTVFATDTVATVPDLRSLVVQAWISETHIQRIKVGQSVDLTLDSYPDKAYKAVIREISKSADPVRRWGKSSYFRVDIEMEKTEPEIMKPGMSVRCEVRGPEYADVLLVPLERTAFDGQSFWVKPAGGGPLKLAALDYDEFAVAAAPKDNPGLKPGQVLVPVGAVPKPIEETRPGERK